MKSNILGDLTAERDHDMLDSAFFETPDYKSITEGHGKTIIVGRRGVGKSALYYQLAKIWSANTKTRLIQIAPDDYEIIGLRHAMRPFSAEERLIRAGAKLVWRYALLMEAAEQLQQHYKLHDCSCLLQISGDTAIWRKSGNSTITRLTSTLIRIIDKESLPEQLIGNLAQTLNISSLEVAVKQALDTNKLKVQIIIDRLDEGYEPDSTGISILTGLAYATNHLNSLHENLGCLLFYRDNVFRAIERHDPDYSRNLEGEVLRLHWDEYTLLNMISSRLRIAFNINQEKAQKVWDRCTAQSLQTSDGFKRCLRLTLYRPRDLLVLLNAAFHRAAQQERNTIIDDDIEQSARNKSQTRLDDLLKEYAELVPGLEQLVRVFAHGMPELAFNDACSLLDEAMQQRSMPNNILQHMEILGTAEEAIRTLYSIGFVGIKDSRSSMFTFCHDGKRPDIELAEHTTILVHPCYWIALDLTETALAPEGVQDIHDDYEIEVRSDTPAIRHRLISQFMGRLTSIPEGAKAAQAFEEWSKDAIKILFPSLDNVQLHPNGAATQRRDVIARNNATENSAWKRILEDYESRQIVFEVKNFSGDLGPAEYRQVLSYLSGTYGKIGFIINRDDSADLMKGPELEWVKTMYHEHGRLIIKLPAKLLISWLSKLRSPQKHNAADKALNGLIDRYVRNYLTFGRNGQEKRVKKKRKR